MEQIINAILRMKSLYDTMLLTLYDESRVNNFEGITCLPSYPYVKVMSSSLNELMDFYNSHTEDVSKHFPLTSPWDVYDIYVKNDGLPF